MFILICPGLLDGGFSPSCAGRAVADYCALAGPREGGRPIQSILQSYRCRHTANPVHRPPVTRPPAHKTQFPAVRVGPSEFLL